MSGEGKEETIAFIDGVAGFKVSEIGHSVNIPKMAFWLIVKMLEKYGHKVTIYKCIGGYCPEIIYSTDKSEVKEDGWNG